MKICIILGTRPEIIKMSSIIRYCQDNKLDYFIIHTNQHYSKELDSIFFKELNLPKPKYNLNVGSGSHGHQTAKMLAKIEDILVSENPKFVLVQGDTNSVLAGALSASKLNIMVGHVEAGLRSYDFSMPEEKNRIVTDHISDFLFCPTIKQTKILIKEGILDSKIFEVGNTIVDAVLWAKKNETDILNKIGLNKGKYCLLTLHRAENVDNIERLKYLIRKLKLLTEENIIFPIHPRTKKMLDKYYLNLPNNIKVIKPIGFLDMITLEKNAKIILTDSGGLQEEGCILNVPCITLRTSTERPETIDVGANKLFSGDIKEDVKEMCSKIRKWNNPFGNGKTGEKIINILKGCCNPCAE